jgi:two-component system chemotaxis response regulator CheV
MLIADNMMELIDFRVLKTTSNGRIQEQIFGINVFKVKEVIFRPEKISSIPNKSEFLEGMINLRGQVIPIINLQKRLGYDGDIPCEYLIITELNNISCGFMAHKIKKIHQVNWEDITSPPKEIQSQYGDLVTSITLLGKKEIMLILDFEKIIAELDDSDLHFGEKIETLTKTEKSKTILCIDDSQVARSMAVRTLEPAGYNMLEAVNAIDALQIIKGLFESSIMEKKPLREKIGVIICDIEMPLMDGFTFTKTVKDNPSYRDIPIILHSSLSKRIISDRGKNVGADDYLTKFNSENLLQSVRRFS